MSPIINPDLSDVVSEDPPVGTHTNGRIVRVKDAISGNNNPMLIVEVHFEHQDAKYKAVGFHVYSGPGAQGYLNLLRATHFDDIADRLMKKEKVPFDTDSLIDQPVGIVVEEYMDKKTDPPTPKKSIQRYLPV